MIADPHKLGNPDAFDALADLFLGEMSSVHAHDAALGASPRPRATSREQPDRGPITPAERSALPRLALVREEPAEPGTGGGTEPPCVEALVLGHLPVMASAWASQYVRHVAERTQSPVAMVRLSGEQVRIELHVPAGMARPYACAAGFEGAIDGVQRHARRVVVTVDAGREPALSTAPGIGRVTLLTSGDEAGLVAAYGLVKTLSKRLREGRGIEPESILRVSVMGAPPERADYVLERLRDAARAFLGVQIRSDTCIARIGSGPVGTELYAGPTGATIADLVAMVGVGPSAEPAMAAPTGMEADVVQDELPDDGDDAAAARGDGEDDTERDTAPDAGELASIVGGLEPIAARCPHAGEVELAIDDEGVLHALVRAEAYGERGRALERLTVAAAWAECHREVLSLTLGGREIAPGGAMMHVLTDQPAGWRRLLDGPVRVHAIAPASRASAWTCVSVN